MHGVARFIRVSLSALALLVLTAAMPLSASAATGVWSSQISGTTQAFYGAAFTSASTGWVVGGGGLIMHTTNGGTQWSSQASGVGDVLAAVAFPDANNGGSSVIVE